MKLTRCSHNTCRYTAVFVVVCFTDTIQLPVMEPFHSELVDGCCEILRAVLARVVNHQDLEKVTFVLALLV